MTRIIHNGTPHSANPWRDSLLYRRACVLAVGIAAAVSAMATDFTVTAGSPTNITADVAAIAYGNVYVNDDLTIDGTYCAGLANISSTIIGASATKPVTVVVTNGARWITKAAQKMTFTGKGGTIIVSQPQASTAYNSWGAQITIPDIGTVYDNAFGTVGLYNDVEIDAGAEAAGGIMDLARLLPNGTASFRNVKNVNPDVAARILFQGGAHWVQNDGSKRQRFTVENNAKIILESVDGCPINLRSLSQNFNLFSGAGTLETRGDGDFLMGHYVGSGTRTVTLSTDEGGEIVWNHKGRTVFTGGSRWKIGNDNILPYGAHNGPVVLYNDEWVSARTTLDLNGKTVTVNGLLSDGSTQYKNYNSISNSSETVATLCLNVAGDTNLNEVLTANFAPDAISDINGIKLQKIGAGTLSLGWSGLPAVHSFEVAEGMFVAQYTSRGGNLVAKGGAVLTLKHPYLGSNLMYDGFCPDTFAVDAGDGTAVLSNVWQKALTVRSGTASIENGSVNVPPAERSWRPTASVIGAVAVDEGGALDVVRGRLAATNISIAAGASLRIRGGAGTTNRVEFYNTALSDRYYKFIFKESQNKKSFGMNKLYLCLQDGTKTFGRISAGDAVSYTLNETAKSASGLSAGQYMYSCPNGIEYSEYTKSSCVYSRGGLSEQAGWGGVIINENKGLRLDDTNTWVTLTIRLRADTALPLLSYQLACDWLVDKLCAWEVQASADGTTWRTVDERRKSDIYTYSGTSGGGTNPDLEGYGTFNFYEPFQWRCLAADNAFNCEGSVQVDEGGVLDLSCVPEANVSIKSLTVDAASGGGTIVKFRPAENGALNLTGLGGQPPKKYIVPVALPDAVDASRFATWRITVDGEPCPNMVLRWSNGVLKATSIGFLITFR